MKTIPRTNSAALNLLRVRWLDFYLALQDYDSGITDHIAYNYGSLATLGADFRTEVEALGEALEDADGNILDGFQRAYLRSWRDLLRVISSWLSVPQYFAVSAEERLAALRDATGDVDEIGNTQRPTTDQRGSMVLKSYMVSAGDTLESIAQLQMGAAWRWREIAAVNRLDYPYVTDDETYETEVEAGGQVEFYLPVNAATNYVIPAGTRIGTSETADRPQIVFATTAVATILAGTKTILATVAAQKPGPDGNVPPNTITEVIDPLETRTGSRVAVVTAVDLAGNETVVTRTYTGTFRARVRNAEAMTGGLIRNVKKLGEMIRLPMIDNALRPAPIRQAETDDEERRLFGVDIYLSDRGCLGATKTGLLEVMAGYDNLAQALSNRLYTPRGDLINRPIYGSYFHRIIGQKSIPEWQQLAELEALDTVNSDPRIASAEVLERDWSYGAGSITLQVTPVQSNSPTTVTLPVRRT